MPEWILFIASLPTSTKTARMRLWRALKSSGAAALRDGVYLLPHSDAATKTFAAQAEAVIASGGQAQVLPLAGLDSAKEREFRAQFDRSSDYDLQLSSVQKFSRDPNRESEGAARRQLAALRREAALLFAIDFFPSGRKRALETALAQAEAAVNDAFSPDEPRAARAVLTQRKRSDYRGRVWATRRHLWVDRVCSAWLIRRFIDPKARFVWLVDPADCPARAVGFDFDGAELTHIDNRVTFEVLVASFGLEGDAALMKLGALVHYLDVGGDPVPEAAGLETVMAGLRSGQSHDDQILAVMTPMLDGLYAGFAPAKPRARRMKK
jgi:hypothetical protein